MPVNFHGEILDYCYNYFNCLLNILFTVVLTNKLPFYYAHYQINDDYHYVGAKVDLLSKNLHQYHYLINLLHRQYTSTVVIAYKNIVGSREKCSYNRYVLLTDMFL